MPITHNETNPHKQFEGVPCVHCKTELSLDLPVNLTAPSLEDGYRFYCKNCHLTTGVHLTVASAIDELATLGKGK